MKILRRLLVPLLAALSLPVVSSSLQAQSLQGSRASVDRMYRHAVDHGIYFYKTGDGIRTAAREGRFVRLTGNADYALSGVSYPYVRPATHTFVERLAAQYRATCGERLVVTSGARPRSMRLLNGVDRSVHPTGIAVDLRRSRNARCASWLRRTLLELEAAGVLEATEERSPPHFHVAVFPTPYSRYVQARGATVRTVAAAAPAGGTYRVRRGDSLWGIARRHSVTVEELKAANGLSSSFIRVGQELVIRRGAEPAQAAAPQRADSSYRVRRGDSLWGIARRHSLTVDELKAANGLRSSFLREGQDLVIPAR